MSHPLRAPLAVLVVTASLLSASAQATVVVVPPLEEMVVACDVIAEVTVADAHAVKDGGRILTLTTLDVKDGWKGTKAGEKLELYQIGGDLDGRSSWIVGQKRFQKGERLVFFGVKHKTRTPSEGFASEVIPYGIGFGIFKVDEQLTGEKVIELVGDVVAIDPRAAKGTKAESTPATRRYDTLAAFKALVDKTLAGDELPVMNKNRTKLLPKHPAPAAAPAPVATPAPTPAKVP